MLWSLKAEPLQSVIAHQNEKKIKVLGNPVPIATVFSVIFNLTTFGSQLLFGCVGPG